MTWKEEIACKVEVQDNSGSGKGTVKFCVLEERDQLVDWRKGFYSSESDMPSAAYVSQTPGCLFYASAICSSNTVSSMNSPNGCS